MIVITNGQKQMTISIDSYQYKYMKSKADEFDYDANWLDVAVSYYDGEKEHKDLDPCLLTTELVELAEELEKVVAGEEDSYVSDFLEPYLKIVYARDVDRIAVIAHFVYDTEGPWKTWKITQFMQQTEAKALLEELKAMSAKYPVR